MRVSRARVTAETPYQRWPEYLSYEEVGILLGTSAKTVQRMTAAGELAVERLGRLRRIHKSALRPQETTSVSTRLKL